MKVKLFSTTLLFCLLALSSSAKVREDNSRKGWYVGLGAGIPSSLSSFSSFAPGGPHAGVFGELSAGYRFNSLVSLEADLGLGRSNLAAQQGCIDNNYYLAFDGKLYYASLLGKDSWSVKDFKSRVSYGRFGLSVNFNLLSWLSSNRWGLEVSPLIAAYCTKSALVPFGGRDAFYSGKGTMHFGYGASLKASYRFSDHFHIGFKTGLTSLTGKGIDAIPDHGHKGNLIWENSLQLCYDIFPTSGRKGSSQVDIDRFEDESSTSLTRVALCSAAPAQVIIPSPARAQALPDVQPRTVLPESTSVYFAFDKWDLKPEESLKLQDILEALRSDSSLGLSLEGWCNRYGSKKVNMTISRLRADSVKKWFVSNGIAPERIEATGKGRDPLESDTVKARRVDVQLNRLPNR